MTGNSRKAMWAVATLCGVTGMGLVVFASFNLDSADKTASVVAAVAALADLGLGTYAVLQALGEAGGGVRARGTRAIAAGGSISGNAIGARSKVDASAVLPAPPATPAASSASPAAAPPPVEASGDGTVAAAGDVSGNALGDDSEVR
ncbi:hypothetical protein ACFWAP_14375 [Streptomyces goshikiensis]|uniref:hypothetical protein n=1 Tax=Streptomyces goshikiensis TaxID=1942 RepID=UPI003669EBD6